MDLKDKLDKDTARLIGLIGKNVLSIRHKRGLTQEALAEKAGINEKFISAVENAREDNYSIGYLVKLAYGLDVNIQDLLKES